MSQQITIAFVNNYTTNVQMLLQQKGSRFAQAVTMATYVGKGAKAVEQFGPVVAQKRVSRHAPTPFIATPQDARWVYPVDYEWSDLIDDQDKLRMIIDPQGPYSVNGANAIARAQDDEIISAFFGTNMTGENGTTSTTFPTSTQQVANTVGGAAATGLNVAKLRAARQILRAAEVDFESDPIYCAISAKQENDLLNEIQVVSTDYNDRPVLKDGKLMSFLGFNFLYSERLGKTGNDRLVPVWAKSGMHLGMWNSINASVDKRPDRSNATQVYVRGTFGATRLEEKKIVQILATE